MSHQPTENGYERKIKEHMGLSETRRRSRERRNLEMSRQDRKKRRMIILSLDAGLGGRDLY